MTNELTTELQLNVDSRASKITIQNEAQLVGMVEGTVKYYSTVIFTDENIPEAKKARIDLNRVVTLLDNQRKKVKNQYDKPLKNFEEKIKKYTEKIGEVSSEINESIRSYGGAEKQKRSKKLQKMIAKMSKNYSVSIDEIEIPSSWTNKTAFTVKGEPNKKTIEEIAASMVAVASERGRVKNDKLIVENYTKAVGLDSFSWAALTNKRSAVPELIEEVDFTVTLKKEQEERERAKREHNEAIAVLKTKTVSNETVGTATGGIITEEAPKTYKKQQEKTVTLGLTAEHQKSVALNDFIINSGIQVEVIE